MLYYAILYFTIARAPGVRGEQRGWRQPAASRQLRLHLLGTGDRVREGER